MAQIFELDDNNFTKEVKLSEKPIVLVVFHASWCPSCALQLPVLGEIADEFDYVKVCTVDVDQAARMTARYGVLSTPTVLVFRQGQIINMQIGLQTKEALRNMVM